MKKLAAISVFWGLILSYLVIPNANLFFDEDAPRVILKTTPIDPRDFLRGDYVILSFADLQPADITQYQTGDTIYATLGTDANRRATVGGFVDSKPTDGLFLRGEITEESGFWRGDRKFVKYGIEKYFVPEGKGRVLERARNAENLEVEVAISKKGETAHYQYLGGEKIVTDLDELSADGQQHARSGRSEYAYLYYKASDFEDMVQGFAKKHKIEVRKNGASTQSHEDLKLDVSIDSLVFFEKETNQEISRIDMEPLLQKLKENIVWGDRRHPPLTNKNRVIMYEDEFIKAQIDLESVSIQKRGKEVWVERLAGTLYFTQKKNLNTNINTEE